MSLLCLQQLATTEQMHHHTIYHTRSSSLGLSNSGVLSLLPSVIAMQSTMPPMSPIMLYKVSCSKHPDYVRMLLQEVFTSGASPCRHSPSMVGHRAENLEVGLQILAEVHDGCDVAAAVTVIGRGPDSHNVLVFEMILSMVSFC